MFLAALFLIAFARSLASPAPISVPGTPNSSPSPICVVAAATSIVPQSQYDPTRTRTLFDILYSCIGVIMLCTYISIHQNLPDRGSSWIRVKWMRIRTALYALLTPEFVIVWAIRERIRAKWLVYEMRDHGWTRTHGFFFQMGGLVQLQNDSTEYVLYSNGWQGGSPFHDLRFKVPRIPEKEIQDRGKGDLLAKAIVVIQTTWFVSQCIARHAQDLVLTEIELVTLAFAALNMITYWLWWDKPLNVEYPIYFDEEGKRVDGPEEAKAVEKKDKDSWYRSMWEGMKGYFLGWKDSIRQRGAIKTIWKKGIAGPFTAVFGPLMDIMVGRDHDGRGDNFINAMNPHGDERFYATIYGSVIGVIFGGIHLIGWNFEFPTTTEQLLWRASSLVITLAPLLLGISAALVAAADEYDSYLAAILGMLLFFFTVYVCPLLYFVARIINLFLAFFTLRGLPESAYQNVKWTELLPHI